MAKDAKSLKDDIEAMPYVESVEIHDQDEVCARYDGPNTRGIFRAARNAGWLPTTCSTHVRDGVSIWFEPCELTVSRQ